MIEDLHSFHRLASYECGADSLMKEEALMLLCQEIAEEHASLHNLGYDWGMENGVIWVESMGDYEILRRPLWKERLELCTNTGKASPLQARRFVEMRDAGGELIAKADLMWVLIDINRRRPMPFKRVQLELAEECPPRIAPMPKQDFPAEPMQTAQVLASRRDEDFNGHINNASYLIWLLDSLDPALCPEGEPLRWQIHFRKESQRGDKLSLEHYRQGQRTHHRICCGEELRAEVDIEWR